MGSEKKQLFSYPFFIFHQKILKLKKQIKRFVVKIFEFGGFEVKTNQIIPGFLCKL
jgi:hypothetical protein